MSSRRESRGNEFRDTHLDVDTPPLSDCSRLGITPQTAWSSTIKRCTSEAVNQNTARTSKEDSKEALNESMEQNRLQFLSTDRLRKEESTSADRYEIAGSLKLTKTQSISSVCIDGSMDSERAVFASLGSEPKLTQLASTKQGKRKLTDSQSESESESKRRKKATEESSLPTAWPPELRSLQAQLRAAKKVNHKLASTEDELCDSKEVMWRPRLMTRMGEAVENQRLFLGRDWSSTKEMRRFVEKQPRGKERSRYEFDRKVTIALVDALERRMRFARTGEDSEGPSLKGESWLTLQYH